MISYILFIVMIFSLILLISVKHNNKLTLSIVFKTITSLFFIAICISSQLVHRGPLLYFFFILTALTFSLLGDIFLAFPINILNGINSNFKRGLICFTFAHVFFSMAFMALIPLSLKDIFLFFVLALILLITLKNIRGFNFNGMFPFVALYTCIISFMVSKSLSTFGLIHQNLGVLLIILGAILFFISDIILSFIYFHKTSLKQLVPLNLIAYYIGQGLIALSILYF